MEINTTLIYNHPVIQAWLESQAGRFKNSRAASNCEKVMRLDKWLKLSRVIKRRTVAQMACEQGRVYVNDRAAKSCTTLHVGDRVHIELGTRALTLSVAELPEKTPPAQEASRLFSVLEEIRRPKEDLQFRDDDWD